MPMASTTKIMTAITAIENCQDLDEKFEIESFYLNENFEKVKIIHDSTYPYAYVGLKVKFSKCGEKKKTIQEIYPFIYIIRKIRIIISY